MFPHESTPVYQHALEYAKWCEPVLDRTPKQSALHAKLDLARTTVLLKIAAGTGRETRDDSSLEEARHAALECAACLDLLFNKRVVSREEMLHGKESLRRLIELLDTAAPEVRADAA